MEEYPTNKAYLYIKSDGEDVIIKIVKIDLIISYIRGSEDLYNYIIDDYDIEPYSDMEEVFDLFKENFDVVEEIESSDFDDFIKKI